MNAEHPRLVIGGLSGDSGKTLVTLSLLAGLRARGLGLAPFKKGPDYIDAAWLSAVSGGTCRNLDTYLSPPEAVRARFVSASQGGDFSLIEGNRGVFDGKDAAGTHSTAELAKLLNAPVLLVVSAAKVTRTVGALVAGIRAFDPDLAIAGVVLNRVAGRRHERILRDTIGSSCGLPVLGVLPKLGPDAGLIPGRHLGLVTPAESGMDEGLRTRLAALAVKHLDLDRIIDASKGTGSLPAPAPQAAAKIPCRVKVGFFKDSVFTFYYPENLEALRSQGAELVAIDSLRDRDLQGVDALYVGGGFPETQAEALAGNRVLMEAVRKAGEDGMPIYAECGGLIYLSRSIAWKGRRHPMAGLLPVDLEMRERPVGHGYARLRTDGATPFFAPGETVLGHEFHYSTLIAMPAGLKTAMRVEAGTGVGDRRDGLMYKRCMACYTHIHADSAGGWAGRLVAAAAGHRDRDEILT